MARFSLSRSATTSATISSGGMKDIVAPAGFKLIWQRSNLRNSSGGQFLLQGTTMRTSHRRPRPTGLVHFCDDIEPLPAAPVVTPEFVDYGSHNLILPPLGQIRRLCKRGPSSFQSRSRRRCSVCTCNTAEEIGRRSNRVTRARRCTESRNLPVHRPKSIKRCD
jgi:hypothetical protein